jgi:YidC/Oxa1 family membrane protein insertase
VDNQRNMIMAIVLSALILFGWSAVSEQFFPQPKPPVAASKSGTAPAAPGGSLPGAAAPAQPAIRPVQTVLAESPRIAIRTPRLQGSINLKGARLDDLLLLDHKESVKKDAKPIRLLEPAGTRHVYYSTFGWSGQGAVLPDANTLWQADGTELTPEKPVTLSWNNGQGQTFAIKIAIDKDYMFTIEQSITNGGAGAIGVNAYGMIRRDLVKEVEGSIFTPQQDQDIWTMHVGPVGAFNGAVDFETDYSTLDDAGAAGKRFGPDTNWLGFGSTYWLTALIPDGKAVSESRFDGANKTYQAAFADKQTLVGPGQSNSSTSRFFAGAKEVKVLNRYQDAGVANFGNSIDWGWFSFIEKPIFKLLDLLFGLIGNFGFAIIALTFIVRGLMFPIAQRQFASMAGMRALQPKMKALQDRYKDDKPRLQQEMMKLYSQEKINPLGGCLPMLIQIPVFYGLYKVLMVSTEMRHQPFIGWIKDLSGPDPANLVNLAALGGIPLPAFLGIGILALLMGITMYMQFKLNPSAPDPVQQQMFAVMPWIMMFIMAPFASGLLLYWVTSNILTIAQQKWLYSKHPALKEPLVVAK